MLEKTEGQSRMDNPEKLATLTQDEDNPEKLITTIKTSDLTSSISVSLSILLLLFLPLGDFDRLSWSDDLLL
jgi:hypothetical protein